MNEYKPKDILGREFHNIDEMLKEKTVLFLGAGASKPYGLPLGTELQDAMSSNFNDSILLQAGFDGNQIKIF